MKLLTAKKRKIAILFTGGLGDTLLFVPLLKEFKRKDFTVTCIFYAKYKNDCLLDNSLFDKKIFIRNKLHLVFFGLSHLKQFTNLYISHFGAGKLLTAVSRLIAKKRTQTVSTTTGYKRDRVVISEFTDAEQNLYLLYSKKNAAIPGIASFYLPQPIITNTFKMAQPYYVVQLTSGNNSTPYRNWPFDRWLFVIQQLCLSHPEIGFVVVGDEYEKDFKSLLEGAVPDNCKILIGETSIQDLFNIVANSSGYIGQDSGIMHLAVALRKKTLSIFGPSNEALYRYHIIAPKDHKVITVDIACRPCSSWKNANRSRVTHPSLCPDLACLTTLDQDLVLQQIKMHFSL